MRLGDALRTARLFTRSRATLRRSGGFTYLALLFAIAILGVALAITGEVASTTARREREAQLRWVGAQFTDAIASYYYASPAASARAYPRSLDDLLLDTRFPNVRRHLRQVYLNPITDEPDWMLIPAPQIGFSGVATPPSEDAATRQFVFTPTF
jgi:type II secretory pathway pseudopilin PulG